MMKVKIDKINLIQRGGPCEIGNVYANQHHKNFRVVLNVMQRHNDTPWKNVICININPMGEIVGASCEPEAYMRDHQDLVGRVIEMPELKIEWLHP